MAYIGQAPTKIPLTEADITAGTITNTSINASAAIAQSKLASIVTADITTNQIDETLMKDAFVGDFSDVTVTAADAFLYGDATDSGNTKKDTIQGILDLAGGSGSLVLISSSEASGVASIDFTGLDNSTYVMYMMTWEDLVPAVDASDVSFRVGDTGGFDSGASDYDFHRGSVNSGSASYGAGVDAAHDAIVFSGNTGSSTNESANGYMYLYGIGSTTCFTSIHGAFMHRNNAGNGQFGWCGGYRLAAITCDRVQIFFDAGNISTGRVSLYGLAYA